MILNDESIQNKNLWESKGFILPMYDRTAVREKTQKEPVWLHFGAGNIFRSLAAVIGQNLLDKGLLDKGIIVAESYDPEIIDVAYKPFDDLSVSVILKADGNIEKTVIGSVVESIKIDDNGISRLEEIFAAKNLQFITLTITEKGYSLKGGDGFVLPDIEADYKTGPSAPKSFLGRLAALCYHRYENGAVPLTLVSMDNCSRNGSRLFEAVHSFATQWADNNLIDNGFIKYVEDNTCLSFPWTMVDKITPGPDDEVATILEETGLEGMSGTKTSKGSHISAFVNAEESEYFIIEDVFPNGRPLLDKAGVILTNRETVEKVEKMKVCTCLNPLHTGLAIFGCLLSYSKISDAMKDKSMKKLVQSIADEGLPVVVDPVIISPLEFVDTVINVRFPNPFIPDTPQRIATDTSLKIPIRFGETLKAYAAGGPDVNKLIAIPLVLAGWLRYLHGVDDNGSVFPISPDPILSSGITNTVLSAGESGITALLANTGMFGADLIKVGIAQRVAEYYSLMIKGPGSVRKLLNEIL